MTTETKEFSLGAVLSITAGRMLAQGIGDIYEILNFMTNDNLFTHQLPRAMQECQPHLLNQFPQLKEVSAENVKAGISQHEFLAYMAGLQTKYGPTFEVRRIPADAHQEIDPITELVMKLNPASNLTENQDGQTN